MQENSKNLKIDSGEIYLISKNEELHSKLYLYVLSGFGHVEANACPLSYDFRKGMAILFFWKTRRVGRDRPTPNFPAAHQHGRAVQDEKSRRSTQSEMKK
mmetsp:Transcript_15758/g.17544  ORF Transcript_15758/g.17544 Transcript_15758/m.17544 type:complete len:100 (-) Transcript_15758:2464-2763(-)